MREYILGEKRWPRDVVGPSPNKTQIRTADDAFSPLFFSSLPKKKEGGPPWPVRLNPQRGPPFFVDDDDLVFSCVCKKKDFLFLSSQYGPIVSNTRSPSIGEEKTKEKNARLVLLGISTAAAGTRAHTAILDQRHSYMFASKRYARSCSKRCVPPCP